MEEKQLRARINKIRGAITTITKEINAIYGDNEECRFTKPVGPTCWKKGQIQKDCPDCKGKGTITV